MTGCRVGKITIKKTGVTVQPVKDQNLFVISRVKDQTEFDAISVALEEIRSGNVVSVGVVIVRKDGSIFSTFNSNCGYYLNTLLGAIERLKTSIIDWMKESKS